MNTNTYDVISIDAWAGSEPDTWEWNSWHGCGNIELDPFAAPRQVLRAMKRNGYITNVNLGDIEDDGYNLVIVSKKTREPLFAIVYGDFHN